MTRKLTGGLVAALGTIALVATACGGDDPAPPAAAATAAPASAGDYGPVDAGHGSSTSDAAEELRASMRKLWEDHVTWTRLYIVSAVAGLPDTDAAAGRLLQNQDDIGAAVAEYYGEEAGAGLTELLREHILVAADLVGAAKAGDSAAVERHRQAWYANGDEVDDLLAGANPAWPAADLRQMMRGHLDQTLAEATARLQGDWGADIVEYDRIHEHILEMADVLAAGIVEQFPERFEA